MAPLFLQPVGDGASRPPGRGTTSPPRRHCPTVPAGAGAGPPSCRAVGCCSCGWQQDPEAAGLWFPSARRLALRCGELQQELDQARAAGDPAELQKQLQALRAELEDCREKLRAAEAARAEAEAAAAAAEQSASASSATECPECGELRELLAAQQREAGERQRQLEDALREALAGLRRPSARSVGLGAPSDLPEEEEEEESSESEADGGEPGGGWRARSTRSVGISRQTTRLSAAPRPSLRSAGVDCQSSLPARAPSGAGWAARSVRSAAVDCQSSLAPEGRRPSLHSVGLSALEGPEVRHVAVDGQSSLARGPSMHSVGLSAGQAEAQSVRSAAVGGQSSLAPEDERRPSAYSVGVGPQGSFVQRQPSTRSVGVAWAPSARSLGVGPAESFWDRRPSTRSAAAGPTGSEGWPPAEGGAGDEAEEEIARLRADNADLRDRCVALGEQRDRLAQQNEELRRSNAALAEENERLCAELQRAESTHGPAAQQPAQGGRAEEAAGSPSSGQRRRRQHGELLFLSGEGGGAADAAPAAPPPAAAPAAGQAEGGDGYSPLGAHLALLLGRMRGRAAAARQREAAPAGEASG
eukprot:TRINITY_DN2125_c1_g1_i2.p1 TRINITY_DN2125_c1_g1~~TRINITY_DN2125_c1_g1_i2.p1  ORF type:complete len:604 (+),score=190.25 TRINITY_DN2125_c1_g1_i2:60-1814(+)